MRKRVNLMRGYPRSPERMAERPAISEQDRRLARKFGVEYFDGDRRHGYGGYRYHPRFWTDVVREISNEYRLASATSVLDVGCAKGFMLRDLQLLHPHLQVVGVDVSRYALNCAHPDVSGFLVEASADALPFKDKSFDLVLSINTLHNLTYDGACSALSEIMRVSRKDAFVMVDGWKNESEKKDLDSWILTAQTVLHEGDWIQLFARSGYEGDYWFWKVRE